MICTEFYILIEDFSCKDHIRFQICTNNFQVKGNLSPSMYENKIDKDLYCIFQKLVLIRFIQRNQGHRDSVMHEFSCSVNKVNKAVTKVRTIGDRLLLITGLLMLNKQNEELSKRLNEVENHARKFASMDSLPSGQELLDKGRQEATRAGEESSQGQGALENQNSEESVEDKGDMKESIEKEGNISEGDPRGGGKTDGSENISSTETKENGSANDANQGNYFNTTWNNVRVNKRLQAIEDGVDKLFSMLDILTAEQHKLEDQYTKNESVDKEGVNMEDFMKLKDKLDSVAEKDAGPETSGAAEVAESKDFESNIAEIKERLEKLESEANSNTDIKERLNQLEANKSDSPKKNLSEATINADIKERPNQIEANRSDSPKRSLSDDNISDLKKKLREIEAKNKEFAMKQDLDRFEKDVNAAIERLRKVIDGLISKGDMEEYVTWPGLEDALNVRGYDDKRGSPKERPKESPKERPKESPNGYDEKRGSPRDRPKERPKESPKERLIDNGDKVKANDEKTELKIVDLEKETAKEDSGRQGLEHDVRKSAENKREEMEITKQEPHAVAEEKPADDKIDVHPKERGEALPFSLEKTDPSQYPSAELQEFLRKVSFVASKYGDLEAKVCGLLEEKSKDDREGLRKEIDDLKDAISSANQLSQNNKASIDDIRSNMVLLMKEGPGDKVKDDLLDGNALDEVRGHLMELDEREAQASLALGNLSSNVFSELKGKQQLIDALYKCVEQLQRNKMDIANATSIFDSEAYKKALDTKVSMNDFDEMMVNLDKNFQEVLQRLDKYATEEESLRESLEKLMDDMQGKLDSKAGESIKKYLESRIAQLQKTRENLASKAGQDIITNAAGLRRPLNTLFHCISCARPVNQDGQGAFESISTNKFPMKKSRGPYTAFNVEKSKEDLQQDTAFYDSLIDKDKKLNWDILKDPFSKTRPCGGSHTAFIYNPKKPMKSNMANRTPGKPDIARYHAVERKREKTIVDLLLGSDGHVYRGRYKMTDLRYDNNNNGTSKFDRSHLRSRSAEIRRPNFTDSRNPTGFFSSPTSKISTPRTLPPIGKEAFVSKTPASSLAGFRDEKETRNGREASMPIENGKIDQDM
eukprot:Seg3243.2 transcript_id=Seg3243.2/GoldUCD/mRNA.D3Y31 product="Glutamine-rich protein 2" protein_id=Seg3243.2/GoldUCD/D3Y31